MGAAAYDRPARDDDGIARMVEVVSEALDAGAIGVATSSSPTGRHHPTMTAEYKEVTALTRVLGRKGHGLASFVPARDVGLPQLYRLQEEVNRPFTYTALLTQADKSHLERVANHVEGRRSGARIFPQVSCRPLVFESTLRTAFALRAPAMLRIEHCSADERLAHYSDDAFRRQIESEYPTMLQLPDWGRWIVQVSPTHPELEGSCVATLARERGVTGLDVAFEMTIDDRLATRYRITVANDDAQEVARLLRLEGSVLGLADSGAHPDQILMRSSPLISSAIGLGGYDGLGRHVRIRRQRRRPVPRAR